ncbi:hypothetical protein NHJ13734_009374 [Beauveria thailandica]
MFIESLDVGRTDILIKNLRPPVKRGSSEEELNEDEELLEQMHATNLFDDDDDDDDQKEMTGENVFASSVTITSNFLTSNAPALKEVAEVLANAATRYALVADQPDLPGSQAVVPAAKPADSCPEYSNIYISASRYRFLWQLNGRNTAS